MSEASERASLSVASAAALKPTIFIALGGTGMKILMRLRRLILSTRWNGERLSSLNDFPAAQFIYFDVDTQEAREETRSDTRDLLGSVVAFAPSETLQAPLNIRNYTDNRSVFTGINEWFPDEFNDRGLDLSTGAAQVRAISRLNFFLQAGNVRGRLNDRILQIKNSLAHDKTLGRLNLRAETGSYRVVVVASSAGGTGSGSFLDTGFMLRSLNDPAMRSSLILVLAGAYSGAGKQRVQANAVAALRELEFCMTPRHTPRYVRKWQPNDNEVSDGATPYDEVYLIDNANIAGESTADARDLYDMVASALFADFGAGDFAKDKRSAICNFAQEKMEAYRPARRDGLEGTAEYRKCYSSFGQAVIETRARREFETATVDLGLRLFESHYLLKARERDETSQAEVAVRRNAVSDTDLRGFLAKSLHLAEEGHKIIEDREVAKFFTRAPEGAVPSIRSFALSRLLLQSGDMAPLRGINDRVEETIGRIAKTSEFSEWPERIAELVRTLDTDIDSAKGSQESSPRRKEIEAASTRVWEEWNSDGENGLARRIFGLIEDREHAGVRYALELMCQARDRLTAPDTGVIDQLEVAARAYEVWAGKLREALDRRPVANLRELVGMGGRGRDLGASVLNDGVKPLLKSYGDYRLRATAARVAARQLRDLVDALLGGSRDGAGTGHNGLIDEIREGIDNFERLLSAMVDERKLTGDGGETRTHWYVGAKRGLKLSLAPNRIDALADEILVGKFGGARELFVKLRTNAGLLEVIEELRNAVRVELRDDEGRLPSIIDVMAEDMNAAAEELRKLMRRAVPWINADLDRMTGYNKDQQIKLFLGVRDKARFERVFGAAMRAAVPAGLSPSIVEGNSDSQILCYSELAGFPLDVINPLRNEWPIALRAEIQKNAMPLFTHKDPLIFPNPVVPDDQETRRLFRLASAYLRGVVFGLLQRGSERGEAPGRWKVYFLEREPGVWLGEGDERTIMAGENDDLVSRLGERLDQIDAELTPEHKVALHVLFRHYTDAVYPPPTITDAGGRQRREHGFMSSAASRLAESYREAFLESVGHAKGTARVEEMRGKLEAGLAEWTREVAGSKSDVQPKDADLAAAQPKRRVVLEEVERVLTEGAPRVARTEVAPSAYGPGLSPEVEAARWHVAIDNKPSGPHTKSKLADLVADGRVDEDSKVWRKGMSGWTPARNVPELNDLPWIILPPPLDNDVPPPL